jgi:hypothetical protein
VRAAVWSSLKYVDEAFSAFRRNMLKRFRASILVLADFIAPGW